MQQTMNVAEIQLAANTIGMQDYLRINDLFLSFQKGTETIHKQIFDVENYFQSIDNDLSSFVKSLAQKNLYCQDIINKAFQNENNNSLKVDYLIHQHPKIMSLDLQKESLKKINLLYKASRWPSLNIYTELDNYAYRNSTGTINNAQAGFVISYNFHGESFDAQTTFYNRKIQLLDLQKKQSIADTTYELTQAHDSMMTQLKLYPLIKKSIDNASEMVKIIQTQQAVGMINADAIYSAYSNYSNALESAKDIWLVYKIAELKLNNIKQINDKVKNINLTLPISLGW